MIIHVKGIKKSHKIGIDELLVEVDEDGLKKLLNFTNVDNCSECKGEGYFSNDDGSDWSECEECLGDGIKTR